MDYKIEILEDERKLKVTTKFDVHYSDVSKIEGVEECDPLTRYTFKLTVGEMFTCEEVVKNIQNYIDARNDDPYLIDASKMVSRDVITVVDVSDHIELEMSDVFKNQGRKAKEQ